MEQNKINIAELLKDCPKGVMLNADDYGEVVFDCIEDDCSIFVNDIGGNRREYDEYGFQVEAFDGARCLLFPSKEVRDWNLFQVKYIKMSGVKETDDKLKRLLDIDHFALNGKEYLPDTILYRGRLDNEVYCNRKNDEEYHFILATGRELKLEEKEQPKFKVGNVVCLAHDETYPLFVISKIDDEEYCEVTDGQRTFPNVHYPTDCTLATPEEIAKWNKDVLEPNHLHYSTSKRKIIDWFNTKDEVVGRISPNYKWAYSIFSHYEREDNRPFVVIGLNRFEQCLPYNEKTAKLIGTTDDWKEEAWHGTRSAHDARKR